MQENGAAPRIGILMQDIAETFEDRKTGICAI